MAGSQAPVIKGCPTASALGCGGALLLLSGAIAAYNQAVNTLQTLRADLVASSDDVQFNFRDGVEPVYRELVKLLLQGEAGQATQQDDLKQARVLIEDLQLAELQDYFQDAC
ncbi:MAG: hypothetical protein AAF808_21660, partial [Cyanobacteria bacterium P01_D01_bin.2]